MGREATGHLRFGGAEGAGKLLLEAEVLILRGAVRAQLPRTALTGWRAEGDRLVIETPEGAIVADLPAGEAARWLAALARPAPGLAAKLGIGPESPVWLVLPATDPALIDAIGPHAAAPDLARLALAELSGPPALEAALAALQARPLPFWAVTVKGPASPLPEARARLAFRDLGWRDAKSCAVSPRLSATRWHPPPP